MTNSRSQYTRFGGCLDHAGYSIIPVTVRSALCTSSQAIVPHLLPLCVVSASLPICYITSFSQTRNAFSPCPGLSLNTQIHCSSLISIPPSRQSTYTFPHLPSSIPPSTEQLSITLLSTQTFLTSSINTRPEPL